MPVIRRRGGSVYVEHGKRRQGKLRTYYLFGLAEGRLTPEVRAAAEAKAREPDLGVTWDWPRLEAQLARLVLEAEAFKAAR